MLQPRNRSLFPSCESMSCSRFLSPEALLQFSVISCNVPIFCRKVHVLQEVCMSLQKFAFFCRDIHFSAVCSGGLRVMNGSLFLNDSKGRMLAHTSPCTPPGENITRIVRPPSGPIEVNRCLAAKITPQ